MSINFMKTDATAPNQLPIPGYYYGKILEASMKQPKDSTKQPYLNVTYELLDSAKNKAGRLYDIIAESDKPFMIYKLQRFGQALGLVGKSLELADLSKIIIGKVIIFRIKIEKSEEYAPKAVVDIGDEGIYYSKTEAANFFEPTPTTITSTAAAPKQIAVEPIAKPTTDNSALSVVDDDEF